MTGTEMHHHTGHPGVAAYVGMWMLMMVPMMLPSLVPVLTRYRRSVRGAGKMNAYWLMVPMVAGYFAVWAALGVAAWAAAAAEMRWEWVTDWRSVAVGAVLLMAGAVQFSEWKARQLMLWREEAGRGNAVAPTLLDAWRRGVWLGVRCSLGCGSLMLALLAVGMMNVIAMTVVAVAISAERLLPARLQVARVAGMVIVLIGVLTIARV